MDNGASSYRRFLDGDESAFDNIIEEYKDSLIFFIERFVQDLSAAEDIAIEVFSDLLAYKNRYNFKVQLKTYLFMIGRSKALNYIKHRDKFYMVDYENVESELIYKDNIEDKILVDELKRVVNEALNKIPEEMQEVIHLIFFEELSYAEAAKIMKKNKKQIDNLLYRAKKELRTIIGKEGELLLWVWEQMKTLKRKFTKEE